MGTNERKRRILESVSILYGDTNADESEQAEALEEIAQVCAENAECLREQIHARGE